MMRMSQAELRKVKATGDHLDLHMKKGPGDVREGGDPACPEWIIYLTAGMRSWTMITSVPPRAPTWRVI